MTRFALPLALGATPAAAATEYGFFSLANTNFIVFLAFVLFIGILVYFKVPGRLTDLLDKRAASIRSELDEARALREEAQTLLASYERRQSEVREQADRIVASAREEAALAAEQAKADLNRTIERRIQAAEDQLASAQAAAIKEVRDRAIQVAIAAAADVFAGQMTPEEQGRLVDQSIDTVSQKLH